MLLGVRGSQLEQFCCFIDNNYWICLHCYAYLANEGKCYGLTVVLPWVSEIKSGAIDLSACTGCLFGRPLGYIDSGAVADCNIDVSKFWNTEPLRSVLRGYN